MIVKMEREHIDNLKDNNSFLTPLLVIASYVITSHRVKPKRVVNASGVINHIKE